MLPKPQGVSPYGKCAQNCYGSYLIEHPFLYNLQVSDGSILDNNGTVEDRVFC